MKQKWEYKKLGDVCDVVMGQSPASDTYNDSNGLPFFQGNADFGKEHPNVRVYCNAPIKIAYPNDILISVRAPIGAINIADCECCIGRGLAAIRVSSNISYRYIYRFLFASRDKLISQGTGSTFKSIGRSILSSLPIPIPPLSEQQRIVAELDLLTGIIDKQNAQLKELDTLAQSIFYDMFGDPIENPKGWEVKKFEELCVLITDGEHATPRRTSSGIYLLSARNVHNHHLVLDDVDYIDEDEYLRISKRIIPEEGDILISCSGSVGRVCIAPNIKFQMVRSVALLRMDRDFLNPVFFEYLVCSDYVQQQINDSKVQVAQANLFQGKIKALKGILPPLALQQSFADQIQSIENQKAKIKASIADTQKLLDYTMDKYFG